MPGEFSPLQEQKTKTKKGWQKFQNQYSKHHANECPWETSGILTKLSVVQQQWNNIFTILEEYNFN